MPLPTPPNKPAVLFVCTGNAGRSQMAQACFRQRVGATMRVDSAGVDPWPHLHPMAVKLLEERGLDLEDHFPKPVTDVIPSGSATSPYDAVITIGDPARSLLPAPPFTSAHWMHWDIGDPADADATPDSEATFRATLAAIEAKLPDLELLLQRAPRIHEYAGLPGIGTGLWDPFDPPVHLPLIREAGFRAIELNLYRGPRHFDREDIGAMRQLREIADDLGLMIWSIHSPDLGSMVSADPTESRRQIDALKTCLDLADLLGAKAIPSHALLLGPFEEEPEACEERMAAAMEELAAAAEPSPAQIAFENPGFVAPAAATSTAVLQRLDRASRAAFGYVLDTGHTNLDGDLQETGRHLGDHLISLHLNDNDGSRDAHLAPGEGTADWSAIRRLVTDSGYGGVLLYEIAAGPDPHERLATTMAGHRRFFGKSGA